MQLKRCKIRGFEHDILVNNEDGHISYQAVLVGDKPHEWGWTFSPGAAKSRAREWIDSRLRAFEAYPGHEGPESHGGVLIYDGMEDYSSCSWKEHAEWVADLTGLDKEELVRHVRDGAFLITDEHCDVVTMYAFNNTLAPRKNIQPKEPE